MAYPFDSSAFDADIRGLPRREAIGAAGPDLLDTLIARFLDDLRAGRSPSVEGLAQRHPTLADQLRELLPMVAAMEQLKSSQEMTPRKVSIPKDFRLERLGDCRMLREIGRGGMGIVYEAEQAPTGRHVAVKVLPWRSEGSSQWRAHFEREARTAASLHHPHIVPVYHYDEEDGWCYYVMHLVEGIGIDEIIRLLREPAGSVGAEQVRRDLSRAKPPARQRASSQSGRRRRRSSGFSGATAGRSSPASASRWRRRSQYSHSRGILHRDIKPGNLLVNCRGSVWVTDFGLAVETDQMLESTAPNLAGTLRYLAPEQLDGVVDRRSDIYALGVTLYELCTLRPLYDGRESRQPGRQHPLGNAGDAAQHQPLDPARSGSRSFSAPSPRTASRRYVSAEALMADLMRFVRRQPVEQPEPEKPKRWTPFRAVTTRIQESGFRRHFIDATRQFDCSSIPAALSCNRSLDTCDILRTLA